MKKIFAASAIILATSLVACTKSIESPDNSLASTNDVAALARHGADDTTGQHPTTGIPQAVISSFTMRYPAATGAEYEKEVEHGTVTYKVKFFLKSQRWVAFFKPDGTFISAKKN